MLPRTIRNKSHPLKVGAKKPGSQREISRCLQSSIVGLISTVSDKAVHSVCRLLQCVAKKIDTDEKHDQSENLSKYLSQHLQHDVTLWTIGHICSDFSYFMCTIQIIARKDKASTPLLFDSLVENPVQK